MSVELVVDNDKHLHPKLADIGAKVECTKCWHRWVIPLGQVCGEISCPECSGQNHESGTG